MTFTGDDLVLGAGTVLARFERVAAQTGLALDEPAEERLLALLAAAYGGAVDRKILRNIRRASNYRRRGQQALAAIELALTGLPPLADEQDPAELRVPPGNGRNSGDWSDGNGASAIPVAARNPPAAPEYRTGDPDKFFDTLYPPVHALAQRLGIDETWLLGLAAYESGWLDPHNRDLNDPFGVPHGGAANIHFIALEDRVDEIGRAHV
jgi:hypothetical protein